MTTRRLVLLLGAALLVSGIIGLSVPVSTSDGNGGSIGCGNAVASDYTAAQDANNHSVAGVPILNQFVPHADFVTQCQSAVSGRRAWTIPVAVIGLLAAGGSMLIGDRTRAGADRVR